jgi:hypothetical protein
MGPYAGLCEVHRGEAAEANSRRRGGTGSPRPRKASERAGSGPFERAARDLVPAGRKLDRAEARLRARKSALVGALRELEEARGDWADRLERMAAEARRPFRLGRDEREREFRVIGNAQEVLASRDCRFVLCDGEAESGSDVCGFHARVEREKARESSSIWGNAA